MCVYIHITSPLHFYFQGVKLKNKLELLPLIFTTQGAITTRRITNNIHFNRTFNEESNVDTRVCVKLLFWAVFEFLRTCMVFILQARFRPIDSPISLLSSIQGGIETESIIHYTLSDSKLNEECYGNIHILVHSLF